MATHQPSPELPDDFAPVAFYGLDDWYADPDRDYPDRADDDDDDDVGEQDEPLYQGTGLTVRALSPEQLQRFLDAHHGQPARLLGSGWEHLGGGASAPESPDPPWGSPAAGPTR